MYALFVLSQSQSSQIRVSQYYNTREEVEQEAKSRRLLPMEHPDIWVHGEVGSRTFYCIIKK